jgi:VWFA-related protein
MTRFPVSSVLLLTARLVFAQTPEIIRVPVRLVTVPTAVISAKGAFVRGLQAVDFRLFDNEHAQALQLDYADEPLSVAVVVQVSDPVRAYLPHVRRVAGMMETLILGQTGEASLITFGDEVKLVQPPTGSISLLDKVFGTLSVAAGNKSRTLDAIAEAAKQLEQVPPQRRRVILLVAQSGDKGSESKLPDVLRELELNNITLYSLVMPRVGKDLIGKTVSIQDAKAVFHRNDAGYVAGFDLAQLIPEIYKSGKAATGEDDVSILTAETGGRQTAFRKLRDLEAGISAIGEELHTGYVLRYTPDHYDSGYHRIRVLVNRPDTIVRARPGYFSQ